MKKLALAFCLLAFFATAKGQTKSLRLASPDGRLEARIEVGAALTWAVLLDGKSLIRPSEIALSLADGRVLGQKSRYKKHTTASQNRTLRPIYYAKSEVSERSNDLTVDFEEGFSLEFRAFDNGLAYRFVTRLGGEVTVRGEAANFQFAGNPNCFFHPCPLESSNEYEYEKKPLARGQQQLFSMPFLVERPDRIWINLLESDLLDYAGMHLSCGDSTAAGVNVFGVFPQVPKTWRRGGLNDFNLVVTERHDFIAKTSGSRAFPWRIVAVADSEKGVFDNDLVHILASENKVSDAASWVKPGKLAWDWWNDWNLAGVPFEAGINTDTYKYFIDFAAANGIEYVGIDDGWSEWFDLLKRKPGLDMDAVAAYARQKGVGLMLWCVWHTLDDQLEPAMAQFERWGIKGLKVDFMDRDDQLAVNYYERISAAAAKRKMLVNFHGAYKPTGLERTYPNQITREGVRGLEYNKFYAQGIPPTHNVTLPFIRNVAGGMDYTPGAMRNLTKKEWRMSNSLPASMTTRCQQLAMYTVFYSPIAMLADAPTAYEKERESLDFLKKTPTVWDESRLLNAQIGQFIAVARRKKDDWHLGAMTDFSARTIAVPLDFLGDGAFEAVLFHDGPNAAKDATDYRREVRRVQKTDVLEIKMAPGGGFSASFSKVK